MKQPYPNLRSVLIWPNKIYGPGFWGDRFTLSWHQLVGEQQNAKMKTPMLESSTRWQMFANGSGGCYVTLGGSYHLIQIQATIWQSAPKVPRWWSLQHKWHFTSFKKWCQMYTMSLLSVMWMVATWKVGAFHITF